MDKALYLQSEAHGLILIWTLVFGEKLHWNWCRKCYIDAAHNILV